MVSILIRPEGRMQHTIRVNWSSASGVSILIRPEGRMQRYCENCDPYEYLFQSSSAPKGGCNSYHHQHSQ